MNRFPSEADTRANYIDPKLREQNWLPENIYREYYFNAGRILLGNKRGKRNFLDYYLHHKGVGLAAIEAKKESEHPTKGLQQVIDYAKAMKLDFVYSTNGKEIYEFQLSKGTGHYIDNFPTPNELYNRVVGETGTLRHRFYNIPFLVEKYQPRYYQAAATNYAIDAIIEGQKRILLTLATGTGKTFIALQIAHKVLQAKWNVDGEERKPKILFLADRNVLADQAINTFNYYEKDLIKINGEEIRRRNGKVPFNAHIFFAIYQAIADKEEIKGYYREYPPDFFDLIIIDECHRGSANEKGSWREIIDYFGSAVHLGMTATPKRDTNVDTYNYFGKPVYEYSLNNGINDGFLTPYKVKRIRTNIDEYIFNPDDKVIQGEIRQDLYEMKDFERKITIPQRTELLAKIILKQIGQMEKTIVFCANQPHALDLRDYINKHKTVNDPEYCVRVTSDEGDVGRKYLEWFQDNEKDIPVILTSSKMLTTGVDARNVRNIVLTSPIGSTVEFKQIIGRGTRLYDGKYYFTIIDFVGATNKFYDKDWDGIPEDEVDIKVTGGDEISGGGKDELNDPPEPYGKGGIITGPGPTPPRPEKVVVKLNNGRELKIIDLEVRYLDENGKPLTAKQFLEKIVGKLPSIYKDENQLREAWGNPDTRKELLIKLAELGFDKEQLNTLREMIATPETDIFDVLSHISYSTGLKTRKERADTVRDNEFLGVYSDLKAKEFLEYVLSIYEEHGVEELKREKLADLVKIKFGTPKDAKNVFGSNANILNAFYGLQREIYRAM